MRDPDDLFAALAESAFRRRFRLGEREDAVKIIEQLQKTDWRNWYYKAVLARYKSGALASPLPLAPEDD